MPSYGLRLWGACPNHRTQPLQSYLVPVFYVLVGCSGLSRHLAWVARLPATQQLLVGHGRYETPHTPAPLPFEMDGRCDAHFDDEHALDLLADTVMICVQYGGVLVDLNRDAEAVEFGRHVLVS